METIFLSWSKDRSLLVAKAFKRLLANVLSDPAVAPVAGTGPGEHLVALSLDLPKGGNWSDDLAQILEHAQAGIICVTPENLTAPWLLFEAGALIRCDRQVRLFTALLDLPASALEGPLGLMQATVLERDAEALKREVHDLLKQVVEHVGLQTNIVLSLQGPDVQPAAWDNFVEEILAIETASMSTLVPEFEALFERKTFQEPFQDCADQQWAARFAVARRTRDALETNRRRVHLASPPGLRQSYDALSSAVDGYAMAIAGLLLSERRYERDRDGRLRDESGELAACERRREAIVAAYARLADPSPPVFDEARTYEELSTTEERKRRLIHPLERSLERRNILDTGEIGAEREHLERAKSSPWLYDRIVFYIHGGHRDDGPTTDELLTGLDFELTRLESMEGPNTLVGLYYALDAIEKRWKRSATQFDEVRLREILERIRPAIDRWNEAANGDEDRYDQNGKVRRVADRLLERTASEAASRLSKP
jgi:hypothetical protein